MASVQQLKSRIRSVNSTKQITKAMQLVAASKMRRSTAAVKETSDYATAARELLADLAHDRDTISFLCDWVREKKELPPCARHSWATAQRIKASFI